MHALVEGIRAGGWVMAPLIICSLAAWAVILERIYRYRTLNRDLKAFHLEAMNCLLRSDRRALDTLCATQIGLPTARLVSVAMERMESPDPAIRGKWKEAVERNRQLINVDLKKNLWVLGTIASASPFIGLFGTVVGILKSFGDIANAGKGGFAIVAAGISEALIATAAGILVAVIAVMAFNVFQTQWSNLVLTIRVQIEEMAEILSQKLPTKGV